MIANLQDYFGPETIYLWLNFGVIPLWLALIFFPNSKISIIFITSISLPVIFAPHEYQHAGNTTVYYINETKSKTLCQWI